MPSVSANSSRAVVRFDEVRGIRQGGLGCDMSPTLGLDARNVSTHNGLFSSIERPYRLMAELDEPIGTIAYLYRRWTPDTERGVFIGAAAGKLYYTGQLAPEWIECGGVTGFQSDSWSVAAYEINPVGSTAPVDVLLLSNALDGLHMIRGDTFECSVVPAPKKPGVISRYAERIWGAGFADDPDMLMYCAPFDPTDWTLNTTHPEDGAGDMLQPSWDGDEFTALIAFGSQLLAFKKRRIWRVLGVNPGEFAMKEQYGGGAEFPGTLAAVGTEVLTMARDGLMRYDGMDLSEFGKEYPTEIFRSLNRAAADRARAALHEGVYYVALPISGSPVNNVVLSYDTTSHNWMVWEDIPVAAWLSTEDGLFFTSAVAPGCVFKWRGGVEALPARWVSGWFEFGRTDTVKENIRVTLRAFTADTQHVTITLETDFGSQAKEICLNRTFPGRGGPPTYTLPFGVRGRRWRVRIESQGGPMWQMHSMTVDMDVNED